MWNRVSLTDEIVVEWRTEADIFEVKCKSGCKVDMHGYRLYIADNTSGESDRMCLGSFAESDGFFCMHKTYTKAFLGMYGISFDKDPCFEMINSNGKVLYTTCRRENTGAAEEDDFSIIRAKKLLEPAGDNSGESGVAGRVALEVGISMNKYAGVTLPCFNSFEWKKIFSLDEDFGLTSVAHIIYEAEFIRIFRMNREWFFGKQDERLFAVCVRSIHRSNPFANAADCTVTQGDDSGEFYHAVGIALLDEGQYFYRIE